MDISRFIIEPIGLVILLFLIVLGVLWFMLPFAVFGTKARLDRLIVELQTVNENLRKLMITEVEPIESTRNKEVNT